jgi:hypothetical protein
LIKLDFEKAFDTIEHGVIYEILEKSGFIKGWIKIVRQLLTSDSSSILLNGVPGKQYKCKRSVR